MAVKVEVCSLLCDNTGTKTYSLKLTLDGNETWTLDRTFDSLKQAETHAIKWGRKWIKRL